MPSPGSARSGSRLAAGLAMAAIPLPEVNGPASARLAGQASSYARESTSAVRRLALTRLSITRAFKRARSALEAERETGHTARVTAVTGATLMKVCRANEIFNRRTYLRAPQTEVRSCEVAV